MEVTMKLSQKPFGKTKQGEKVTLYTITNDQGMVVSVSDYGANIISIIVPDKNGKQDDIALGYDNVKQYEENGPGYGSFIGRHANRIANASVVISGKEYKLEKNDGNNNLHSGSKSYNKYLYETEIFKDKDEVTVEFSRLSPDMEQGLPGNLDIVVSYTLTNDNELVIEYYGVSDKDTIINFTNHSYFNLAGHNSGSIEDHQVMIDSEEFTLTDDTLIPTGEIAKVEGTPMDFRKFKKIGKDIEADYQPLRIAGGYDHNYVLKTSEEEAAKVAELWEEKSGRRMEVFTDAKGLQLYTGNFILGNEKGKEGYCYQKRDGVCFETQYYPNSCNISSFPSCLKKAGEPFESVTIYKFSVK
jgi:aldose 1-epimerase